MTESFIRALIFAARVHGSQMRKGSDTPYIVHPVETAFLLAQSGAGDELIAAGLLHDTCEDTDTTPEHIEDEFGKRVCELVMSNTENKSLSWEERKAHTIKTAAECDDREKLMLLCADKLSNAKSMVRDYEMLGNDLWSRFKRGRDKQEWYYRGVVDALKKLKGVPMYDELCAAVDRLFKSK